MEKLPRFKAIEFYGDGDPMFGGAADDRVLGPGGRFLTAQESWTTPPAVYVTRAAAEYAATHASNKRKGSLLGFVQVR